MKKLWQMIKGCPLFSILIISGVIVTAGGYVGAALGVYKWDVSFHHPMAQTVLLDERVATGTDATSTDAPGKAADVGVHGQCGCRGADNGGEIHGEADF